MITPEIISLYRHCTKFKVHLNAGNLVSTHPADKVWYKLLIPFGSRAVTYCALSRNNGRRHSRNKIVRRLASRARCCHFCDGACDVLFTILPPGSSNTCRPGPMAEPMEKRWIMLFFNPLKLFPGPSLECQAMVWAVGSWLHHNLCWASTTTTHAESPLMGFFHF